MDLQIIKDVSTFLHEKCVLAAENCKYDGKYLTLPLSNDDQKTLKDANIPYDDQDNRIDLNNKFNDDFIIFYDLTDFVKRYKISEGINDFNILILSYENSYLLKRINENLPETSIVTNYDAYKKLLSYILEATDFISYKNTASQELVLISEKGPVQIGYNPLEERIINLDDLPVLFKRLQNSFSNLEFQGFFRDAIIETIQRFPKQERFYQLISALSILLDIADRDYQLYIRKFAFDKIKSKFKEERIKYFDSIEKNIDNINKQVTAFPLTFSASAFASYQVKDKPLILILILIVYSLYTFIAWKIINLSKTNMNNVYKDVITEAKSILKVYDVIYKEFKPDFKKILTRIKHVNSLILILRISFIAMLVLFVIFVVIQICGHVPVVDSTIKPRYI